MGDQLEHMTACDLDLNKFAGTKARDTKVALLEEGLSALTIGQMKGCGDCVSMSVPSINSDSDEENPLMNELVLEKLMCYFTLEDLVQMRLVNRVWNRQCIPHLRALHNSIAFESAEELEDFIEDFEKTIIFPFAEFEFDSFGELEAQFVSKYGKYISQLSIWSKEFPIHQVAHVLANCVALKYLSLRTVPFFTPESDTTSLLPLAKMDKMKKLIFRGYSDPPSSFEDLHQELLNNFLILFPNLTMIRFDCNIKFVGPALTGLQLFPTLASLQKLDIPDGISEEEIKILAACKDLGLKILKLGHVEIIEDSTPLEQFLASQGNSLTELWIFTISVPKIEGAGEYPRFVFPPLPALKRLVMDEVFTKENDRTRLDFVDMSLPELFPTLKKLEIMEEAFSRHLEMSWPSPTVNKLTISIETGKQHFCLHEFWRIRDMFPNLTKLALLYPTSGWLTMGVFRYLTNLRELSIEEGNLDHLDSVMTGMCCIRCKNFEEEGEAASESYGRIQTYLSYKDRPSLVDLKRLKILRIHQCLHLDEQGKKIEELPPMCKMSDASGYLAFLQMQPLESLEINSSATNFSEKCLAALRNHHTSVSLYSD